jgi:DNA processing protein
LFNEIAQSGAVISEFPFGRRADRQTFPMRNRIVSGMCQALIVVESDLQGGSMISARFAAEQGRTVFAVPGRIYQPTSRGCHQLIREGAMLLSKPEDVVEELGHLIIIKPLMNVWIRGLVRIV